MEVLLDAKGLIHNRGRGPEVRGTRIQLAVLFDHFENPRWTDEAIAELYAITVEQVQAARQYVSDHYDEIAGIVARFRERVARGNPPRVRAALEASRQKFLARLTPEQRQRLESVYGPRDSR